MYITRSQGTRCTNWICPTRTFFHATPVHSLNLRIMSRADFNVRTLQHIAGTFAGIDALERVVIVAPRADFDRPYAFRCEVPAAGHPLRAEGLELLFARAATIAVAIVGTSKLRIHCEDDSTLVFLQRKLSENSALISNMQQFGPVLIDRGGPEDVDIDLCHLPFRSRSSASQEPHSEPLEEQLFVGIDYGRSDIKTVVVDASDRLLAKYVTRWWRIDDSGVLEYVDPQVLTSHKCHVQCLAEAAIAALQQVKDFSKKTVCGVGISAAGCVKYGKLCGIPPAMGGVEDTDATRQDVGRERRPVGSGGSGKVKSWDVRESVEQVLDVIELRRNKRFLQPRALDKGQNS